MKYSWFKAYCSRILIDNKNADSGQEYNKRKLRVFSRTVIFKKNGNIHCFAFISGHDDHKIYLPVDWIYFLMLPIHKTRSLCFFSKGSEECIGNMHAHRITVCSFNTFVRIENKFHGIRASRLYTNLHPLVYYCLLLLSVLLMTTHSCFDFA